VGPRVGRDVCKESRRHRDSYVIPVPVLLHETWMLLSRIEFNPVSKKIIK
jgi:hypothetical protein